MKKKKNREAMFSARKQILNIGFVVLILAVTFIFLFNSLSDFNDPGSYKEFLKTTRWWILPLGVVFLVLSVLCEARNLGMILKLIGHRKSLKDCTVYASSKGALVYNFYPYADTPSTAAVALAGYIGYGLLCLSPSVTEGGSRLKWHYLKSKISHSDIRLPTR